MFVLYSVQRATRQDVEKEIEKLPDPVQIGVYRKSLDDEIVLTELRKIA
jgi:hypothetical protein